MFGKKANGAPSGFEKKAHNRPDKAGQCRSCFCSKSFKPISYFCSEFFQSVGNCANNRGYRDARGQKDGGHSHAIFFEDLFNLFSEGHGLFSFLNQSLQISKLFISLCNSFLGGFFVLGKSIFIIFDFVIFFILFLNFLFSLFNFFCLFCSVKLSFFCFFFCFFF